MIEIEILFRLFGLIVIALPVAFFIGVFVFYFIRLGLFIVERLYDIAIYRIKRDVLKEVYDLTDD